MTYKQLTQEQRYQIYAFMKAGFTQKQIAAEIRVSILRWFHASCDAIKANAAIARVKLNF